MIEITLNGVYNIYYSIQGMRNPKNSWSLMDSSEPGEDGNCTLGEKDLRLARMLTLAGTEHSKFLRFIPVCFDINAPFYWWKEFDTYKFAEKNSCSTMHKLTSRPLTPEDFSFDSMTEYREAQLKHINTLIEAYNARNGDIEEDLVSRMALFRELIQDLPSAFNQKRTVITNYAELRNIYFQRRHHKLEEWRTFCQWMQDELPYSEELICLEKDEQA
ncbi:MAG: hypothetical protein PHW56_11815 [Methanosarcinaceae archaeon]|nr:hypothetical protein [Methanosarcinaceae archaeon]